MPSAGAKKARGIFPPLPAQATPSAGLSSDKSSSLLRSARAQSSARIIIVKGSSPGCRAQAMTPAGAILVKGRSACHSSHSASPARAKLVKGRGLLRSLGTTPFAGAMMLKGSYSASEAQGDAFKNHVCEGQASWRLHRLRWWWWRWRCPRRLPHGAFAQHHDCELQSSAPEEGGHGFRCPPCLSKAEGSSRGSAERLSQPLG